MNILGTIGYRTEVDPSGASAGVKRMEATVQAAMRRIDAMEATAKLQAEDSELRRKVIAAKRELVDLDNEHADPAVGMDDEEWQARRKVIQAQIKELNQQKIEVGYAFREAQRTRRELEKTVQAQNALVQGEQKLLDARRKATTQTRTDTANLAKLREHYVRIGDQIENIQRSQRKRLFWPDRGALIRLENLRAQLDLTGHKIRELGGDTDGLDADIEKNVGTLRRWGSSLANVRFHAGVMSLTLKQAGIVIGALGPYIFGVLGAASTLIGVLGQGLVGAVGLGAAGLTGLGLGFLGVKAAIGGSLDQMKAARTEFDAYQTAVRKYGKNSDQAETAQEKLNKTLHQMPDSARDAVKSLNDISNEWRKLTEPTREAFFDTMADGLERAEAVMPAFAKQTNLFAKGLEGAADNFMDAFSASEMRGALQGIMQPLSAALPTIGSALGNISQALGNVFSSFARHFGPVADGIENWSESFLDATENTGKLNDTVDDMMASAESLVHFFAAGGRVLSTFFGTGADEGRSWVDDMTQGLDDLNDTMRSASGQSGLNAFFDDSIEKTKVLGDMLGNLGEGVFRMAELFAGPAESVGKVVSAVADLITKLQQIPGLAQAINVALGGFLLTRLPFVGSMFQRGFASMGTMLTTRTVPALASTRAAMTGLSGATLMANGQIRQANGRFGPMATSSQRAAMRIGAFGTAAGTAGGAVGRLAGMAGTLGSRALGLLGPIGMVASIGFLAADAFGLFGSSSEEATMSYGDWTAMLKQSGGDMRTMNGDLLGMIQTAEMLGPSLQKGGREGMLAMQQLRTTIQPAQDRLTEIRAANQEAWDTRGLMEFNGLMDKTVTITTDLADRFDLSNSLIGNQVDLRDFAEDAGVSLDGLENSVRRNGEVTAKWRDTLMSLGVAEGDINALSTALQQYQNGLGKAEKASANWQLALANVKRAASGMELLGPRAAKSMQPLLEQFGQKRVAKWSIEVEDGRAQRDLLELANKAGKLGGKKQVIDIMASDSSAKQKIDALNALLDRLGNKKVNPKVSVNTGNAVSAVGGLGRILGQVTGKDYTAKVSADVGEALRGIGQVIGLDVPDKNASVNVSTGGAIGAINGVISALAGVPAVTTSIINVITRRSGNYMGGVATNVGPPGYATGGMPYQDGRQGGRYARPTFLVGEEKRPEYVIATNPSYRRDNLKYLYQAAAALGVPAYAKGKGGGKRPDPGKKYVIGAIPESAGSARYQKAKDQYSAAKQKVKDLERSKKQADKAEQRRKIDKKLDSARKKLGREKDQFQQAKVNWKALKKVNASINLAQAKIDKHQSLMDFYSMKGSTKKFEAAQDNRLTTIDGLLKILRRAERGASGQFKVELGDRIAQLMLERESTARENPGTEGVLTPAQTEALERLQMDQALAQLTTDRGDDVSAQTALVGFWESVLSGLRGRGASPALITEAAQNLLSAKGDTGGGGGGGGISQEGVYADARLDLYRTFGSNTRAFSAAASPFSGSGPAGVGGGSGVSITNNFDAPPPDPHTWSRQQAYEIGTLGV